MRHGKYNAIKTTVYGITFDSKHEAERYCQLHALELEGEISGLELQPRFRLSINGVKICDYYADFSYYDKEGCHIVEDAKGFKTAVYRLKKKLFKALYDFDIVEV